VDIYIEKLIEKRRSLKDILLSLGIVAAVLVVSTAAFLILTQWIGQFSILVAAAAVFFGYRLMTRTRLEFEYLLMTDSLDIDKIIAQRRRVRIFSADYHEFEALGKVKGRSYGPHVTNGARTIFAGSSMDSENLWFATLSYKGQKTVIYFEPDARMLDVFRRYIPRKVLD